MEISKEELKALRDNFRMYPNNPVRYIVHNSMIEKSVVTELFDSFDIEDSYDHVISVMHLILIKIIFDVDDYKNKDFLGLLEMIKYVGYEYLQGKKPSSFIYGYGEIKNIDLTGLKNTGSINMGLLLFHGFIGLFMLGRFPISFVPELKQAIKFTSEYKINNNVVTMPIPDISCNNTSIKKFKTQQINDLVIRSLAKADDLGVDIKFKVNDLSLTGTGVDDFIDKNGITNLLSFPDGQFVGIIIYIVGAVQNPIKNFLLLKSLEYYKSRKK